MSGMIRRPPATRFHLVETGRQGFLTKSQIAPTSVGPPSASAPHRDLGRQTFGAVDSFKAYGGAQAGSTADGALGQAFQYTWQDRIQVNPAHEQPKLIFYSGAQPFIRWGAVRRFVRTFMAASPRFQGRWAYVGFMQRHYAERPRLTGIPGRLGSTYVYTPATAGPGNRGIRLGGPRAL